MIVQWGDALTAGLTPRPSQPLRPGEVRRVVGIDPGARVLYYAILEIRADGPRAGRVEIVEIGAREWDGADDRAAVWLLDLYRRVRPDRVGVEDQFLSPALFRPRAEPAADAAAKGLSIDPGAKFSGVNPGKIFADLRRLATLVGVVAATWDLYREEESKAGRPRPPPCLRVEHSRWKENLAPAHTAGTELARAASLLLLATLAPGAGPGRGGLWRKDDHDRAAAFAIALLVLGVRATAAVAAVHPGVAWPAGVGGQVKPPPKPRAKRPRPDKVIGCDGAGCAARWSRAGVTTIKAAREGARADGWAHRGKLDLCPVCAGSSAPAG